MAETSDKVKREGVAPPKQSKKEGAAAPDETAALGETLSKNAEHIDASPVLDVGAIDRYQTPLELTQKKEGQDSGKRANYSQSNTTERDGSH